MKKILIYRHCSLGDFIVSLPAIKQIKNRIPNSKIYLACSVIKKTGYVKPHFVPIKKGIISEFIYFEKKISSYFNFFKTIKNLKFDMLYYLNEVQSNFKLNRDFVLFSLAGIKNKKGFDKFKYDYEKFNETYYLSKRVNQNIKIEDISFKNIFNINKIKYDKNYITLSLGGKNYLKKWNVNNWIKLVEKINFHFPNLKIKILGSIAEKKISQEICKINKIKIVNMCGKTDIVRLFEIIASSQYHISHDDGTMHIASAFKKKGIAIFGITSEKGRWFPLNFNQKIFYPRKNIDEIKVEEVFDIVYKNLLCFK